MGGDVPHDFVLIAGNLALDFVNTVGNRLGDARDDLPDVAALNRWARRAGVLRGGARCAATPRQLARIRGIREELHRLFRPLASGLPPDQRALDRLGGRLARLAARRELRSAAGKVSWEWRIPAGDPDRIIAPILESAAALLVSRHVARIRECDGAGCGWLFVDRSPAGRRRWCSMLDCGNRAKVQEFYRRAASARSS